MNDSLQHIGYALGSAILNSFWQMGLLWLLVNLTSRLHKKISTGALSNLSFVALMTGLLAFAGSFCLALYSQPEQGLKFAFWRVDALSRILNYTALLYLVLLILPVTRLFQGSRQLYKLRYTGRSRVPGHLKIFLLNASNYLGIKRRVQIFLSTQVSSPLTLGCLRPVILLPVSLITQLSPLQLEALILHELAHIRRNDYLINFLTQVALTLLYFNPFARALTRTQHLEREKAADHWVLQFEYNNHMYASTLLQLVREKISGKGLLAVAATGNASPLYHRIEWIMGRRQRRGPAASKIWGAGLSSLLLCCLCLHLNQPVHNGSFTDTLAQHPPRVIHLVPVPATAMLPVELPVQATRISVVHTVKKKKAAAATSQEKTRTEPSANKQAPATETEKPPVPQWPGREIPEPGTAVISFISHTATGAPILSAQQEQQLQRSLQAARRVIAEARWKQIAVSLGNAVSPQQKAALKASFISACMSTALSEETTALLRTHFNEIDWEKVNRNLVVALGEIRLDSLHHQYLSDLEQLRSDRKTAQQHQENSRDSLKTTSTQVDTLSQKIAVVHQQLVQVDSLRRQKIVEL
ncbi:hypothetical protein GCM10027051_28510 [Niabella terrae]